jgi:integrase
VTDETKHRAGGRRSGPRALPDTLEFSYEVRLWKIGKTNSKSNPHHVRWTVAGGVKSATFPTGALADSFRSELLQAMRRGQGFEVVTGLPESKLRERQPSRSWFDFCRAYVAMRWKGAAAKTRDGITDSLATAALALVEDGKGRPSDAELRKAFRWAVIPSNAEMAPSHAMVPALRWLERRSLPVSAHNEPEVVRLVLLQLTRTLDKKPAAGDTARRRRRGLNTALEYAVEKGDLPANPLTRVKIKRAAAIDRVDPRVVVNRRQARALLTAVSYVGSWRRARGRRLVAFFATLYYAGLRPAEAVGLREKDCYLPEKGWGRLTLAKTRPVAGRQFTDSGERHDERGLKQRDPDEERPVPIPPVLVRHLRAHIDEFGTAPDGRVFRNERGGLLGASTFSRVGEEARRMALPPAKVDSPLAGRPYDLRHAAITLWLNSGVPVAEVARRVGNSVEMIHKRYEGCVDGQERAINGRIEAALEEE